MTTTPKIPAQTKAVIEGHRADAEFFGTASIAKLRKRLTEMGYDATDLRDDDVVRDTAKVERARSQHLVCANTSRLRVAQGLAGTSRKAKSTKRTRKAA